MLGVVVRLRTVRGGNMNIEKIKDSLDKKRAKSFAFLIKSLKESKKENWKKAIVSIDKAIEIIKEVRKETEKMMEKEEKT